MVSDSPCQTLMLHKQTQMNTIFVSNDLCSPVSVNILWSHAVDITLVHVNVKGVLTNFMGRVGMRTRNKTGMEGGTSWMWKHSHRAGSKLSHCSSLYPGSNLSTCKVLRKSPSGQKYMANWPFSGERRWVSAEDSRSPRCKLFSGKEGTVSYSLTNGEEVFPKSNLRYH